MITFSENTHFDEALLAQGTLLASDAFPLHRYPTSHVHDLLLPITTADVAESGLLSDVTVGRSSDSWRRRRVFDQHFPMTLHP